jgi:hypothetical protein
MRSQQRFEAPPQRGVAGTGDLQEGGTPLGRLVEGLLKDLLFGHIPKS